MILLKQVLVASDFSDASGVALDYGRALARTFGSTLQLLHVTENPFLRPAAGDPHAHHEAIAKRLSGQLTAEDRESLHAEVVIETSDSPAESIVRYAKTHSIDVIVLGTHGRGAMAQLLVGSVAEKVVRTAPCPVLTVRHPEHGFLFPDQP
jgi:nucleotide-binding universal stress UspA family protein